MKHQTFQQKTKQAHPLIQKFFNPPPFLKFWLESQTPLPPLERRGGAHYGSHQKQYIFHKQLLIPDLHMNRYIENQIDKLEEVYSLQAVCHIWAITKLAYSCLLFFLWIGHIKKVESF